MIDGHPVTVVDVERNEVTRIISARPAAKSERNDYRRHRIFPDTSPHSPENASAPTDLAHLDALTDDEIETLALADPDNPPLSETDIQRLPRTPRVTMIRRALGLTPAEFSARFRIPLYSLDDWERGRSTPDAIASTYLFVIASDPAAVDLAFTPAGDGRSPTRPLHSRPHPTILTP
jgi:putative transcriptional regulator